MEVTSVIAYHLDLAVRLVDTTTGTNVSGRDVSIAMDGEPARFSEKPDHILIFQNLTGRRFRMTVRAPAFEEAQADVDLDRFGPKDMPLLELHLVPGNRYPGSIPLLSLEGACPGIEELMAVRMGENACLIREYDPRRRTAKLFNPHHLELGRVHYALVDPDQNMFEPFRIIRQSDDQTIKTDRVLEMEFRNYFPVTPIVFGKTFPDGRYCLRVRDLGTDARWLVRWTVNGQTKFQTVDFRTDEDHSLQEGGI